ncbi:MAG: ankyrin repeat domain-containing protein [Phycisphaerales bacterium]|nr:ankyrin repeat domain-containing protein [Phycisphaerales bacterium]
MTSIRNILIASKYELSQIQFVKFCEKGDLANAEYYLGHTDIDVHYENDLAFYSASVYGHLDIAKWLYSFGGIDIHFNNDEIFRWSCGIGHFEFAQWLYSLGNVDIRTKNEYAFRMSCANGKLNIAKWLYSLGGIDISNSKVVKAVMGSGDDDVIAWFLTLQPRARP